MVRGLDFRKIGQGKKGKQNSDIYTNEIRSQKSGSQTVSLEKIKLVVLITEMPEEYIWDTQRAANGTLVEIASDPGAPCIFLDHVQCSYWGRDGLSLCESVLSGSWQDGPLYVSVETVSEFRQKRLGVPSDVLAVLIQAEEKFVLIKAYVHKFIIKQFKKPERFH